MYDSQCYKDQDTRHSLKPGKRPKPGQWCLIMYDNDNCDCVVNTRFINIVSNDGALCQQLDRTYGGFRFKKLEEGVSLPYKLFMSRLY